jgi:hypothetical protein
MPRSDDQSPAAGPGPPGPGRECFGCQARPGGRARDGSDSDRTMRAKCQAEPDQ